MTVSKKEVFKSRSPQEVFKSRSIFVFPVLLSLSEFLLFANSLEFRLGPSDDIDPALLSVTSSSFAAPEQSQQAHDALDVSQSSTTTAQEELPCSDDGDEGGTRECPLSATVDPSSAAFVASKDRFGTQQPESVFSGDERVEPRPGPRHDDTTASIPPRSTSVLEVLTFLGRMTEAAGHVDLPFLPLVLPNIFSSPFLAPDDLDTSPGIIWSPISDDDLIREDAVSSVAGAVSSPATASSLQPGDPIPTDTAGDITTPQAIIYAVTK